MSKRFPENPPHPERNCWGCDRYCAANAMLCGNGSERTQHPAELFGPDWVAWKAPEEAPKNTSGEIQRRAEGVISAPESPS